MGIQKVELTRFAYTPKGTLSRITLPNGHVLFAVEPPWNDNKQNISCIPEGRYIAKRNKTGKHQYYSIEDVEGRSGIEIHPANYYISPEGKQQLNGCIAPGLTLNENHIASVLQSRVACGLLLETFGDSEFELIISQYRPEK